MDVVRVFNGLGNQMSQYAFYLAKKKKNKRNVSWIFSPDEWGGIQHNGFELDRLFGIKRSRFRESILQRLYLYSRIEDWRGKLFQKYVHVVEENAEKDYDPQMLDRGAGIGVNFYYGGWHTEKYFKDIRNELLLLYHFDEKKLNPKSVEWMTTIRKDDYSCSLHVRRGDFLSNAAFKGIATDDYYLKAIDFIKQHNDKVNFYVFSNDIEWCKKTFGMLNFYYIDCNTKEDSWQDMFLMKECRNHINANSTFSWWGAWLSTYPQAITIVPKKFVNTKDCKDIYPEKWMKL